jgi:hypothetical protein
MKPVALSISTLRLDRLMLWSQLWLLKLAQQIAQAAGAWAPQKSQSFERAVQTALGPKIDFLGKLILALIVLKAGARTKPPRKQRAHGPPAKKVHNLRRLFGARLRKLIRAKNSQGRDLRAKISALLAVLQNAEKHIARAVRRLPRGFYRRVGGAPREAFIVEALGFAPCVVINSADTS